MEKRMVWLGLVVMVVGLCSSGALATTMGTPVATLKAQQISIGPVYSISDLTLSLDGKTKASATTVPGGVVVDEESESWSTDLDFESNMIFANLGYGVSDKLEVFVRLGMADLEVEDFDGDSEFAWGLGAKATFYEEAALKLGALIQMTWGSASDETTQEVFDDVEIDSTMDIDWYEIKIAVGPSYELTEGVSVYGGPFYHMFRGDLEADGSAQIDADEVGLVNVAVSMSADIEEASAFGGYIGAQIDLAENLPLCVEYQFTSDASIFGAGLVYRF